jgi:biotin operon repressor
VLFDLRGKRKRVVQVSYAALAFLFLLGFIGFGIGVGGGPGGIFDAIGLTDSSNTSSGSSQFQDEVDAAQQKLAKNPDDTAALLKLAENEYLLGKEGVSQDQSTGQISISNEAHTDFGQAADAWSKYLKVNKGKPDATVASEMVYVYAFLNDADGAIEAQRVVAESQPNSNTYGTLAQFQYLSGDIAAGDESSKKAVSLATGSQRKAVQQQLDQLRKQGLQVQKQQKKAKQQAGGTTTPGTNPLQTPFGGTAGAPAPVAP